MANVLRKATVAIIGLPNSGKSTLLNTLIGEKISAVSSTPQTTRNKILGVISSDDTQLIFLDTPGMHIAKHTLNKRMLHHIDLALIEADYIVWIVDASGFLGVGEKELAKRLQVLSKPTYLVLNKIDLLSKQSILKKIITYKDLISFHEIIPISAKCGVNTDNLLSLLKQNALHGEWEYTNDIFTNQTERDMAKEFIREKIMRKTYDEIPHSTTVVITKWTELNIQKESILIEAEIVVEEPQQRKIILGNNGSMIKNIRQSAQRELKKLLQKPVVLQLHIRVITDWRNRPDQLNRLQD